MKHYFDVKVKSQEMRGHTHEVMSTIYSRALAFKSSHKCKGAIGFTLPYSDGTRLGNVIRFQGTERCDLEKMVSSIFADIEDLVIVFWIKQIPDNAVPVVLKRSRRKSKTQAEKRFAKSYAKAYNVSIEEAMTIAAETVEIKNPTKLPYFVVKNKNGSTAKIMIDKKVDDLTPKPTHNSYLMGCVVYDF